MNMIESLIEKHGRLRQELSTIEERLPQADFGQMIHEFILNYQRHEEVERVLFKKVIQTMANSKEMWPLRGYDHVLDGTRTLLKELLSIINSGHVLSIQHAFSNFHLLALSHFKYEENWIFPLIKRGQKEFLKEEREFSDEILQNLDHTKSRDRDNTFVVA